MRLISEVKPVASPFIPCANLATAKFYRDSCDDGDAWVLTKEERDKYTAPYYVVLVN